HDVVYDSRRHDNEVKSAEAMVRALRLSGMERRTIDTAVRLILETRQHSPARLDRAAQILVDADLITLSAAPERYVAYSASIRYEYAWVPEVSYRTGRAAVLQAFLDRPVIYYTRAMKRREPAARSNVKREVGLLTCR